MIAHYVNTTDRTCKVCSQAFSTAKWTLIPAQDAIKRRFNRVLARFTILSNHFRLGAALGLSLLSFRPPGLN